MKKWFKNLVVCLCIAAMTFTPFSVSADEKLYERYGFQEEFEYSDVMIGHALKTAVSKIFLNYTATLSYSPVTFDDEALINDYVTLYGMYHNTNTEEEIISALLQYAKENISNYLTYSGEKTVDTSGSWMGSGVVISEDGYIATNAHVATLNDESRIQLYLVGLQGEVYDDLSGALYSMEEYGITMTDEEVEILYYMVLEDSATRARVIEEEIELEVCFPDAKGNTDLDSAYVYEAEVVAEGTQDGIDGLTQDTAILKIKEDNLVALALSDSLPETNSTIVSAGYPSASDEAFQQSGSEASVLSVTVGTGQVARLVPIDNSKYQAIQITTTISGGNSGGPSVDTGLNVEGLNTYVHGGDARYAYMVSAEYVNKLADDFELIRDETTKTFLTGLQMLQQNYGAAALECFERVKELQKDTPYIENLIDLAEKAPATKPSVVKKIPLLLIGIIVGVVLIIVVVILIIVISKKKKRSKVEDNVTEEASVSTDSPPVIPTPPVTTVVPPAPPTYAPPRSPVYPPYGQPPQPPEASALRSTMRKTSSTTYTEPAVQDTSTGSRLIQSDNLKNKE